jgi:hypothetical protein
MPLNSGQVPLSCPAAVAINDDRDMLWKSVEVHLPGERFFRRSSGYHREQVFQRHA